MFGGGFGNRTTTAFGQNSTFGRPTTSFAQPGFGATSTSLFGGQTSQASTSLFGSTAPTQTFGGGFTSGTGSSLFGSQQPTTGTGGGLFGAQNTAMNTTGGLFGSSGTTAFGSNVGGLGTFGSSGSTGLFGQTQQPAAQSTSLFGQASTGSTGLFGSTSGAFAQGATAATGTTIKFIPVTGTDTMQRNGVTSTISTKHYCITCMKEYEGKSLEELRYEDYLANRKGPTQGAQAGSALFGGTGQSTLFGGATSTASTTGGGLFGSSAGGFGQSSVFGQSTGLPAGSSLFGKPASTAPFGTTTTTQSTGFGSFGQTNNLFGSNTSQAKPAFGVSQPSTGLFGSTTPASTGFGTQSTGFGFNAQQQPQQTQGIGLFGQPQNKFGGFGTQTTANNFTFGSTTAATNSTSLFGQKPATTGFGITSTTSASTFGSGTPFGAAPAAGGGLFSGGFNKPQSTGFSFGSNTSTAPALGGTSLNGGSLFGGAAAKPTGLFGGTTTSTGLFGSSNFGTGTGGGFGAASNTGFGGLNFGGGGLGNLMSGAQPTAASSSVTDQIQLLTVLPYGDSPLYKHLRPATGKTDDLLKPSVVPQKPNADSSGFKVSTQINNIVTRKAHSAVALEPSKKSLFDKDYDDVNKVLSQQKASPRYLKLKPKSMLNKNKISTDTNTDQTSVTGDNTNKENIGNNSTYTIDTPYSPSTDINSIVSSSSLPTSPTSSKTTQISAEIHSPPSGFVDNTMAELRSQTKSSETKKNVSFLSDNQDASYQSYNATSSFVSEKSEGEDDDNVIEIGNDSEKDHICNISLRRADYFTVPSLSDLDEMVDDDGKCVVKNFTIGRHNFGNVTFYDAFDVAGLNLDAIVFFHHKEVEIYPNDDVKPPVGVGLNRRAQVTLDRVWPQDKATRQVIKDPERLKQLDFVTKLKRSSEKMNAQFIEYRPPTGSWVFEVEHFSKYGLEDSDDESSPTIDDKTKKLVPQRPFAKTAADLKKIFGDKQDYTLGKKRGLDGKIITSEGDAAMDQFMYDENDENMDEDHLSYSPLSKHHDSDREFYENELHSPIEKLARDLDTSLHKVQLMKASFYVDENAPLDPEISLEKGIPDLDLFATGRIDAYRSTLATKNFPSLLKTQFTSQFPPPVEIPFTDFADEEYKPPLYSPEIKPVPAIPHVVLRPQRVQVKYRNGVVPLEQSVFRNASKCLCDAGVFFGQHFRIGWGKGLTLATQSSICTANTVIDGEVDHLCRIISGRKEADYSPNVVHKLEMSTYSSTDSMKEITENHLDVCLRESVFNFEDGCPILTPKLGSDALHAHCDIEQRISRIDEDYNRQVWELMVALWGNIPDVEMEYDPKSHKNKMLRKSAVSDWLKSVVSSVAENELNESDRVASVVALLSAGKIFEAAKTAMSNDDYNLALLISQIGSSEITRSLMEQQLKQWHESEADQLIDNGRLKIMALVAGHMLFVSSKNIVNTCENLDWKRAFALHLWYITRPSDSLVEALNQYELAFKSEGKFASSPDPPYTKDILEYETGNGRKAEDLCYHLLKLYSRRSYPLETLLNPITHTANVLDYRLSWLIMITLKSIGFAHLSEESEFILNTSFAAQLEAQNLWQWAVFVLLHIKDLNCRINRVTDTIGRNVRLLENRSIGLTAEEQFVSEKLEVPVEWIYYAKAILASSQSRYKEAAWYYVRAERWNEAHDIIMNNLVTNAIINENYAIIQGLLDEIVASERVISGWNYKGGIVYDYLTIMSEINAIMDEQSLEVAFVMEKLQPTMSSVCHKIKFFPTNSIKERLCQAEISKRMIQFIRTILNLQYGKAGPSVRFFVSLVDQLPLPEDYKMQELNEIISWWINK